MKQTIEIGSKIAELRRQNEMTQEKLAERLHVSRQTIYRWEKGTLSPKAKNIRAICELFRVPGSYFFADGDETAMADGTARGASAPEVAAKEKPQEDIAEPPAEPPTPKWKSVLFWIAVSIITIFVIAVAVILIWAYWSPPIGDTYADSITWGISNNTVVILAAIGLVVFLAIMTIIIILYCKKKGKREGKNKKHDKK